MKSKQQSVRYRIFKKVEYDRTMSKAKKSLQDIPMLSLAYSKVSRNIANYIKSTPETELILLPLFKEEVIEKKTKELSAGSSQAANIRFRRSLKESVSSLIDLGIKHTILDRLYDFKRVRDVLDGKPGRFSSFNSNIAQFILNGDKEEYGIANFNRFDELNKKDQDAIIRADNELNRLSDSLDTLEERGELDKFFSTRRGRIARMSYEERYRFLYLTYDIDNFLQRANASKFSFISDTYIRNRHQVLADDYSGKYDDYIRERIAKFLREESRYISSIKNKEFSVDGLAKDIETQLRLKDKNEQGIGRKELNKRKKQYQNRAETIIATETSTAYNFGKLIGFSSLEDINKKFKWNNDWELETRDPEGKYQVCDYCFSMGGKTFTVAELLVIGTQLDRGLGGFGRSGRNTDFKNPSLPMIPGHPNCACYWTLEDDDMKLTSEQIYDDVPIESVRELDPEGKFLPKAQNTLAQSLLGAGMIVGGAYLLSRTNYWNTFVNNTILKRYTFPIKDITEVVGDTLEYISDNFDDDITQSFVNTVKDATDSATSSRIISVTPLPIS